MKIVIECPTCGFERDMTRDEIVTGSWKRAACPVCGHTREPPASPAVTSDNDHEPEGA